MIHHVDCLEYMRNMEAGSVDLVFADPPFNIGYKYDGYDDSRSDGEYTCWCADWMFLVHRILKPHGTFWLASGDEYAAELKGAAKWCGFTTRSWVIWYYTFGVNCTHKFNRSHVHLFHFVKDADDFTFNANDPDLRVPSARAAVYGDKRANPKGKLPDDTWCFPRVAGTFKERQGFHGCQMPEQVLGRIIRASSNVGDVVFDPFVGSGTTLAVAKKLNRRAFGCELSSHYARHAAQRVAGVQVGDPLYGDTQRKQ